jgi:hypothetical protein
MATSTIHTQRPQSGHKMTWLLVLIERFTHGWPPLAQGYRPCCIFTRGRAVFAESQLASYLGHNQQHKQKSSL